MPTLRPVRLGAPIFLGSQQPDAGPATSTRGEDPVLLARSLRALGFSACQAPDVDAADAAGIRAIEHAFAAEDVVIAELWAFGHNMMARDAAERRAALDAMSRALALADDMGARCAVNIAGFLGPTAANRAHPDNLTRVAFDLTVENVRAVIDAVRPRRAKFAIETMAWILPDGPDVYLDLIRAVDRPAFAAHFDPVNMINSPTRYFGNRAFIEACLTTLGPHIVSCHGKDTRLAGGLTMHINEGRPGTGILDWKALLRGVAALPQQPPILFEHQPSKARYLDARDYVRTQAAEAGVMFA